MVQVISLDLAVDLTAGHPQDVQLCLTLVRSEIDGEERTCSNRRMPLGVATDCGVGFGAATGISQRAVRKGIWATSATVIQLWFGRVTAP